MNVERRGEGALRIALVHRVFAHVGGSERDLIHVGRYLAERGHQVHVHCARYRSPPEPWFTAHRLPDSRLGRMRRYRRLLAGAGRVAEAGYDVVVGFGRTLGQDLYRCEGGTHLDYLEVVARLAGKPMRPTRYDRFILDVERRLFTTEAPFRVVSLSTLVRDEIHRVYGFPKERIDVVTNGVDLERFHPRNRARDRGPIRDELGIAAEAPVVLFVGIGWDRKGLAPILEAVAARPSWHVVVAGRDREERRFTGLAERLALGSRAHFVGARTDIERHYAAADVLALASYQEAFGNVVLEALAAGIPVAATRSVGAVDLLAGSLAAGIIEGDATGESVGAALDALLERTPEAERAAASRAAAEPHGVDAMGRRMEQVIRAVAAEKAACGRVR